MKLLNLTGLVMTILAITNGQVYKEASLREKMNECIGDSKDVSRVMECAHHLMPKDENNGNSKDSLLNEGDKVDFSNFVRELDALSSFKSKSNKDNEEKKPTFSNNPNKREEKGGKENIDLSKLFSSLKDLKDFPSFPSPSSSFFGGKNQKKFKEGNEAENADGKKKNSSPSITKDDLMKAMNMLLDSPSGKYGNDNVKSHLSKEKIFQVMNDLLGDDSSKKLFDEILENVTKKLKNRNYRMDL